MSKENKSASFWNSPISLMVIGFLLTTVAGSYVSSVFHEHSWKSKAKFEVFKEHLKDAMQVEEQIIAFSNERIFYLRRINDALKIHDLQKALDIKAQYSKVVQKWNIEVKSNKNKLSFLFGEDISVLFLDYNEKHNATPKSLHHSIRKAHASTVELIKCLKNNCSEELEHKLVDISNNDLDNVGILHDKFSISIQKALLEKENKLFLNEI